MIPPLRFSTKLAFGAGDFGTAVTANLQAFFSLFFLTSVAGLNPAWAGSILLVSKVWDAVNDPIVGTLSDRTHTRWGRRYPWMVAGAIPLGLTFFLQWIVPTDQPWLLFAYYVGMGLLFNTAFTAVNLPYTALTPELTRDYDERTSLNSFRFAFSIGGSILSLLLAQAIFSSVKDPQMQYLWLGGLGGLMAVFPVFWSVWGTWGRSRLVSQYYPPLQESNLPLRRQLKVLLANRAFLYVVGLYLCSWLAVQITSAVLPFFVVDWLRLPQTTFTWVALAVQGTALLMLPFWSRCSQRWGKKATYFAGMLLWLIAELGLVLLQPTQTGLLWPLAVLAGMGVSTAYLIPWSMMPDVIELDELQTGERHEGLYYSLMVLLQKFGLALGLFLVGKALDLAGYLPSSAGQPLPIQPELALLAVRLTVSAVPAVCLGLGLILAWRYPLSRERHAEVLLQLAERRKQQDSLQNF
jgi:glycoside/pentoside/hexuronide:cation symporter, GPH family